MTAPQIASSTKCTVAWQGWQLELPGKWHPVKVEGDHDAGLALFADMHRPRLGIRWCTPKHKARVNSGEYVNKLLRHEVGVKAASEAKPLRLHNQYWRESLLYVEPSPPGRDVWVGFSAISGRALQVIYHCAQRQFVLQDSILPRVEEFGATKTDHRMPWSIFELSCHISDDYVLKTQRLNAGDLSLTFERQKTRVAVRQVAVASLALTRMPLEKWLSQEEHTYHRHYHALGQPKPVKCTGSSSRTLVGLMRESKLHLRFLPLRLLGKLPPHRYVYALHDAERDRLILLDGPDRDELQTVARTVGWARA